MRLVRHLADMPYADMPNGSIVTIGSYDGLHLGHQALLNKVTTLAREQDRKSVVMSFEPTPAEFFRAERPPARLMRFREKYEGLAASDIDIFFCPRFSPAMRDIPASEFIRRVLVHGMDLRSLVIGDDFRFARKREGGVDELRRAGAALGFDVLQAPSVMVDGMRVSSTAIREAAGAHDIDKVTSLLGRPYRMSGKVVRGEEVGRSLGYPTANVDLRRRRSPVMGIYAVRVHGLGDEAVGGVASVGSRPTFDGTVPLLEVHLFDFNRDIYGEYISIDFIGYLREQVKYEQVEDLVAQMHVDADNARSILAGNPA